MNLYPFTVNDYEQCMVPTGTCILSYRGSIAHSMYVPSTDPNHIDDVDLMGVVIGEQKHYYGLSEWAGRGTYEIKEGKWDSVFYDIRKMFTLLLQGNPNVLSILWNAEHHNLYVSLLGRHLINNRNLFIGKHVYNAFAGYAYAQLKKMESRDPAELRDYITATNELKYRGLHPNHKGEVFARPDGILRGEELNAFNTGNDVLVAKLRSYQKKGENIGYLGDKRKQLVVEHGYDAKNAAHCVRLLRMCKEFLATGYMTVERPDAAELLSIKKGKWKLEDVKALAEQLFAEIKVERDNSPLPEEPNREEAEKLLVFILNENFG